MRNRCFPYMQKEYTSRIGLLSRVVRSPDPGNRTSGEPSVLPDTNYVAVTKRVKSSKHMCVPSENI
jgi:hypothetical protein